jgi:3-dehydroquinate synthase
VLNSKVFYTNRFPSSLGVQNSIILFDKIFSNQIWLKKFPHKLALSSGEKTKTLDTFKKTVQFVHQRASMLPKKNITIVSLGGGSIGDLSGFVASIYKRGVNLVHIPTTWLAAIDSSHGGKTALNFSNSKNQLGTIYPAHEIYLVKNILLKQPLQRETEAWGEALKAALLNKKFYKKLENQKKRPSLWQLLPDLVSTKLKFVQKDLFEINGERTKLNLGHTLGHVIEIQNHLHHGIAVAWGLVFAIELSFDLGLMNSKERAKLLNFINKNLTLSKKPKLKMPLLKKQILADKKNSKLHQIKFVLLKSPGQVVIQNVALKNVEKTLDRLQWI